MKKSKTFIHYKEETPLETVSRYLFMILGCFCYALNNEFYNKAFSDNDKIRIILSNISADENAQYWNTTQGNNTQDKIFIISIKEARLYFENGESRKCVPTDYAINNVNIENEDNEVNTQCCCYWLRSSGENHNYATFVSESGGIDARGANICYKSFVRPAMWIKKLENKH